MLVSVEAGARCGCLMPGYQMVKQALEYAGAPRWLFVVWQTYHQGKQRTFALVREKAFSYSTDAPCRVQVENCMELALVAAGHHQAAIDSRLSLFAIALFRAFRLKLEACN
jgi:hypothetical protein